MLNLEKLSPSFLFLCIVPLLFLIFIKCVTIFKTKNQAIIPKSYPIVGAFFAIYKKRNRGMKLKWITEILKNSTSLTFSFHLPIHNYRIITANPLNVKHILKTRFDIYEKGKNLRTTNFDLLGHGIFNADGDTWKFQRQVSSLEFKTKSFRKFVEIAVDIELKDRLIPILSNAAKNGTILDFQDILQRFTFDNICKIAFGYDPAYLTPSLPKSKFVLAFDEAVRYSCERGSSFSPLIWKIKRIFNIGSERRLRNAVHQVREFAKKVIKQNKDELGKEPSDLLSRFLISGHADENFATDIVISFIIGGRDTTSAALTWLFWLISKNREVEREILKEANKNTKEMVYAHAALTESMRLYPPVPVDVKEAIRDDVLPDGAIVKKGTRVAYHVYAMGRMEELWGEDWADYRPERWLERDGEEGNWRFVARDAYMYPVFQGGPRICLGKEMAYLQMKRVVGDVLRKFRIVPVIEEGVEPVFVAYMTSKMEGGFPVRIVERN